MAMARLPGVSGVSARIARPVLVWLLGLAIHSAPQVFIIIFLNGFCSKLMRTIYTLHASPNNLHAIARALPH